MHRQSSRPPLSSLFARADGGNQFEGRTPKPPSDLSPSPAHPADLGLRGLKVLVGVTNRRTGSASPILPHLRECNRKGNRPPKDRHLPAQTPHPIREHSCPVPSFPPRTSPSPIIEWHSWGGNSTTRLLPQSDFSLWASRIPSKKGAQLPGENRPAQLGRNA